MLSSPTLADPLAQLHAGGAVPRHVAVIMDGNGRWARARRLPRPLGHRSGMRAVREVVEGAIEAGVAILSLFAFSQENWQRPAAEVSALMHLLEEYIASETEELHERGVQVRVLGDLTRLSRGAAEAVARVTARTAGNHRLRLNLFISYGGRAELVDAARRLARDVAAGLLAADAIDEAAFGARLYTADCPDPDLLVRTSGEQRISNFLLWQLAYTELVISPVLWPDFRRQHLFDALLEYQRRERRFGRVSA
ncbi:MAG TPA: polyprenyl diphosphate synthase [Gemmatimonadaceae bacterium]|nr:polyprenyl diphosphate synthase [Gemmatimonadaceae bacterium]